MLNLVCFTEELSAAKMLATILPKIVPDITHQIIDFQGKTDLENNIKQKLQHYNTPNTKFLIIRDKDSGDCKEIKENLLTKIRASGKEELSLIRIACHELESFYLGDLQAVKKGLNLNSVPSQTGKKYRNPDNLSNAKQELIQNTGKLYQPVSGSKLIAPHLKLDGSNKSISFNFLISGIQKLCDS
ncbi:MAG: hypothetical protein Ctma_0364 [Catillopecten margaritatus gill symbiont]|uniref:DUF4276 family protein n=1 Tax=Catillopecten margaritatus gill symbiont TaxID=3083288 RepID=A0AAU6PFA4_9GAMM